jgi:hypothetical protein
MLRTSCRPQVCEQPYLEVRLFGATMSQPQQIKYGKISNQQCVLFQVDNN